jgi:acetyltransferase-like isoleucine patch superfamily enzyme
MSATPGNVVVGERTVIRGEFSFKRFFSVLDRALTIGDDCAMEGVQFGFGPEARAEIGNGCFFTNAVLLCELELRIGDRVMIGWNATIADTDFHPVAPAARIEDAIACSPLGAGHVRPPIVCEPVVIEDDVYVGPASTILKGVRVGAGAWIEPGSVVTSDVPPRARVLGNPARVVEGVAP